MLPFSSEEQVYLNYFSVSLSISPPHTHTHTHAHTPWFYFFLLHTVLQHGVAPSLADPIRLPHSILLSVNILHTEHHWTNPQSTQIINVVFNTF